MTAMTRSGHDKTELGWSCDMVRENCPMATRFQAGLQAKSHTRQTELLHYYTLNVHPKQLEGLCSQRISKPAQRM